MADDPALEDEEKLPAGDDPDLEDDDLPADGDDDADPNADDDPDADPNSDADADDPDLAPGVQRRGDRGEQKPQSRAQRRVEAATRIAKEAKERADRLEAEIADIRRGQSGRNQAEEQAAERERLAIMSPEERTDYLLNRQARDFNGRLGAMQFQQADATDRAEFKAMARTDPVYARHADEVERRLTELRRGNAAAGIPPSNVPREILLKLIVGEKALEGRSRAKGKQQRTAAAARQRETTRPGAGARSDARSDRGKSGKTARERLDDVTF